jgi:hypothetical protein
VVDRETHWGKKSRRGAFETQRGSRKGRFENVERGLSRMSKGGFRDSRKGAFEILEKGAFENLEGGSSRCAGRDLEDPPSRSSLVERLRKRCGNPKVLGSIPPADHKGVQRNLQEEGHE